ncbi:hypothetical protein [Brachybacterium sacelli]|uniref:hypothetical protein n=1 Tax=Brachybacterium sacelli TaxID=173364 RepID=UPI0036204C70
MTKSSDSKMSGSAGIPQTCSRGLPAPHSGHFNGIGRTKSRSLFRLGEWHIRWQSEHSWAASSSWSWTSS